MRTHYTLPCTATTILLSLILLTSRPLSAVDLTHAVVFAPAHLSGQEKKAVTMLLEEVEKRSRLRWAIASTWPASDQPVIAVGPAAALPGLIATLPAEPADDPAAKSAEGFRIRVRPGTEAQAPAVFVIGNDARGVLYGVGRLLRALHLTPDHAVLDDDFHATSAPALRVRGHQLGYRPKTHSYDAWDLPVWEQYIRDLAVFGCNAVELIPPRSDDAATSPHFPRPPLEMMRGMSQLLDDYGLDVWIWYPALDKDYANPDTVNFALQEWGDVFKQLPRVDAVFVPGGDPGHTRPKDLMALLEKQTAQLHRYHPKAQMWVSPQGFTQEWLDEFLTILKEQAPAWLAGIVFGPQVRLSLPQLRAALPAQYPIRHYPDITHSRQCQYPVPDWDTAFALTEGREGINPRPRQMASIFRSSQPHMVGFISYSEGCNDDVNKAVWSGLSWDPNANVTDLLREYSRYFIGERWTESFAQGLLALEKNWEGPLLANEGVNTTLQQFQAMEQAATPGDRLNWRFQQALYRAYYDAYTRRRLLHETDLEAQALDILRQARRRGSLTALADAEAVLDRAVTERVAADWRSRIFELGEALFQSIRMQLSVEKYQAIGVDRGANLDTIDVPLNNREWLKERFAEIRQQTSEPARLQGITSLVHWNDPGPGGFYDDLGNLALQPHLVRGLDHGLDPAFLASPHVGFEEADPGTPPLRYSWLNHAESMNDAPLTLRYSQLNPRERYKVRVVYAGDAPQRKIRLVTGSGVEIHPLLLKPWPIAPVEFDIPPEAIRDGELTLNWFREAGLGGNGRGCQVSEVWLVKK